MNICKIDSCIYDTKLAYLYLSIELLKLVFIKNIFL